MSKPDPKPVTNNWDKFLAATGEKSAGEPPKRPGPVVNLLNVNGCRDCPFARFGTMYLRCHAQSNAHVDEFEGVPYPDWCPLKKGPITVELKR